MFYRKFNRRTKSDMNILLLLIFIVSITLGYALLSSNLNIIGTTKVSSTKWDVYFDSSSIAVTNGSQSGSKVTQAPTVSGKTTVTYSIVLDGPGDFYEFTIDAKNAGTLDAMVQTVSTKFYESNGTTEKTVPAYLNYSFTYSDGIPIAKYHKLAANSSEKLKVRVEFKPDATPAQLPNSGDSFVFECTIDYTQADSNAIDKPTPNFSSNDWATIVSVIKSGNTSAYSVGSTKKVDMGSLGTHTLRIANTTTPSECSTEGFSQTACGFVLEFADIITEHRMNPFTDGDSNLDGSTVNGTGNKGGWEYSDMRAYLNSTTYANESIDYSTTGIYSSLPEVLRNAIIDTRVVSGHGNVDTTNYTTTDKIYLLSAMEVWGINSYSQYDSARNLSRQMDYYASQGVTTSSYAAAIKQRNGSNSIWWLRSAYSNYAYLFYSVSYTGSSNFNPSNGTNGVAPAFRIA